MDGPIQIKSYRGPDNHKSRGRQINRRKPLNKYIMDAAAFSGFNKIKKEGKADEQWYQ